MDASTLNKIQKKLQAFPNTSCLWVFKFSCLQTFLASLIFWNLLFYSLINSHLCLEHLQHTYKIPFLFFYFSSLHNLISCTLSYAILTRNLQGFYLTLMMSITSFFTIKGYILYFHTPLKITKKWHPNLLFHFPQLGLWNFFTKNEKR